MNRFGYVARVLVDAGQITVRVGKRRIDLYRAGVALKGPIHIAHLLQCVAHIRVRVSKSGRNPNGLLVVVDGLMQTALLLQNRCQIAVSSSKLRIDLEKSQFTLISICHIIHVKIENYTQSDCVGFQNA